MISPAELRIGNYMNFTFYGHTEQYQVHHITPTMIGVAENIQYQVEMLSGVPLTEEWIKNFGFYRLDGDWFYKALDWNDKLNLREFSINAQTLDIALDGKEIQIIFNHDLIHVHQLQNLYFALTGTELELKK